MRLRLSRAIMVVASLILLTAFITPLWHYDFDAPQYPEGLPMIFYLNHLGGRVDLVNELNHYVGMRKILESDFAEFRVMPWLVALFCVAGLAVAASARRWALAGWVAGLTAAGLLGMADFYSWLYLYGHDLNPHAAITIPPFTPHLLGTYQMMNFHIMSYPGIGGVAIMAAGVLGYVALAMEFAHGSFTHRPARVAADAGNRAAARAHHAAAVR